MDLLQEYQDKLIFSCAPSQYIVEMGAIGCVGWTGCKMGLDLIPDSIMVRIDSHDHEILDTIFTKLTVDSDSMMRYNNGYIIIHCRAPSSTYRWFIEHRSFDREQYSYLEADALLNMDIKEPDCH